MIKFHVPVLAAAISIALGVAATDARAHGALHKNEVAQSQAKPEPTIEQQKLNNTLTMLIGAGGFTGGNVIVSNGDDGMLIIDDKLPTMTDKLIAALDELGGAESLRFVLNTHWHFDHTGGNATLGEQAVIIAHTNVRKRLSTDQHINALNMDLPASPPSAWPVITYDDSVSVHFNGEELKLVHMPASHTDTDTVIYFTKSNVLHTGDLFFNGLFPFVDVDNGGNVLTLTKSIAKLMEEYPADVTIVPGHGPLAKMADLKTFHTMLTETTANVKAMKAAGKSLEQIKAAGVPDKWAGWTWGIDAQTWNAIIYSSL